MKDIDSYTSRRTELTSHLGVCYYQPGNGTRYNLLYGHTPNLEDTDGPHQFFCTWLEGASGRTVKHSIGGYCHWSYVKEKMKLNSHEDAKAIAHFINSLNCKKYPNDFPETSIKETLPRGIKEDPDDRITNAMNEVIGGVGLPHLEEKLRDLKKEIKSEGDTK